MAGGLWHLNLLKMPQETRIAFGYSSICVLRDPLPYIFGCSPVVLNFPTRASCGNGAGEESARTRLMPVALAEIVVASQGA